MGCFEKTGEIKIQYLSSLLVLNVRGGKEGNVHMLVLFSTRSINLVKGYIQTLKGIVRQFL